jgi:hypothetical protein
MENKYLKYKNKYLNLKGGARDFSSQLPSALVDKSLYNDYFLSYHGGDDDQRYKLPANVRVLMLAAPDAAMLTYEQQEYLLQISSLQNYDPSLSTLYAIYNTYDQNRGESTQSYNLSVFTGLCSQYNTIDDLILKDEDLEFRTGTFKVPMHFNRVYLDNYVSGTERDDSKKFKAAGTIEDIPNNVFLDNARLSNYDIHNYRTQLYNKMLIRKFPSVSAVIYPNSELDADNVDQMEELTGLFNMQKTKNILWNTFRLKSVIVPHSDCILDIRPHPINGIRLSRVIRKLVELEENKNKMVTIFLASCRTYIGTHEGPNPFPVRGIPFTDYVDIDHYFNQTQYTANKNISDFNDILVNTISIDDGEQPSIPSLCNHTVRTQCNY